MIDPALALGFAIGAMPDSVFSTATRAGHEARTLKEEAPMNVSTAILYIGTKIVIGEPMTRAEYNAFRGWQLPADENGADEGYLVEYTDGGKPNVPGRPGYVSWSPKEQFDNAYRCCDALPFGLAVEALKKGAKIARAGWNGKGMFVYLVPANSYPAQTGAAKSFFGEGGMVPYNAYMALKGVDDTVSTWAPSGSDTLADDWQILPQP